MTTTHPTHPTPPTPPSPPSPPTPPRSLSILKVLLVRLRFLLVFVLIGAIVGNWSWIMNVADRLTRPHGQEAGGAGDFEWYCPMHPSVVRGEPASCAICGMPLSRRKRGEAAELPPGVLSRLQLSPYRIRQAGVATEEVAHRELEREIRTVGFVEYDERRITDLSARVAGRADELFVSYVGARVRAGDPLYRVYSPDLVATQEEYLLALKTLEQIRARPQHEEQAADRAGRLAAGARERMRLWGISDEQVRRLEVEGKAQTHLTVHSPVSGVVYEKDIHAGRYLQVGDGPYTIADDGTMWVLAEVFERDMGLVKEGQAVEVSSEAYPGEPFRGAASFIGPSLDEETRTVKVRVDVENKEGRLKPGMYVTAVIRVPLGGSASADGAPAGQESGEAPREAPPGTVLAVNVSAVIDTGHRKVVFLEQEGGVFDSVEVVLGPRAGEHYQVLKGLAPGDRVVTAGAFLLDAETRLNPAAGAAYFGASGNEAAR
ncbi:MAG: efflux RND transporter periplasmic adaptor subunit [Planctomycetes bacterium]|nr:efflux RND transporter periplasmic adaptor subunit [Planctomycetota bacterium]